ncbi:hypothetical protein LDL59_11450 [Kaistella anthropi]|nr:hypothetical protein [Kaistella anthropi]
MIFGKSLLGFYTPNEKTYLPPYLLDFLVDERFNMFRIDAIKAIIYVGIAAAVLFLGLKQKINQNIAILIIGLVSLFDLWSVNKRYLNNDNFIDKTFTENPFQTENSELLMQKVGDNTNLKALLDNVNVNKTLETIANKDQTHYRIYNNIFRYFRRDQYFLFQIFNRWLSCRKITSL